MGKEFGTVDHDIWVEIHDKKLVTFCSFPASYVQKFLLKGDQKQAHGFFINHKDCIEEVSYVQRRSEEISYI
jgi:hypothetical protein